MQLERSAAQTRAEPVHLPKMVQDKNERNHTARTLQHVTDVAAVAILLGVGPTREDDLKTEQCVKQKRNEDADDFNRNQQRPQRVNALDGLLKHRPRLARRHNGRVRRQVHAQKNTHGDQTRQRVKSAYEKVVLVLCRRNRLICHAQLQSVRGG